jgi:hypothetical protein
VKGSNYSFAKPSVVQKVITWNGVVVEKVIDVFLVRKYPCSYGTYSSLAFVNS